MEKPILKSYYGDMFFEFMVHEKPKDTILVLEGFPASANHNLEIKFLYNNGYNVIWPHYTGTYQSKGEFLEKNIVTELSEFVLELKKEKAINLWDMKEINFGIKKLILFGGSFSGAISCSLATQKNFDKMVLFAPVWDFKKHNDNGSEQDLDKLIPFVKRAYRNLIRFRWDSLVEQMNKFNEVSLEYYENKLKLPILVLHDPEDGIVSIKHTKELQEKISSVQIIEHDQGHGMKDALESKWDYVHDFLLS